MRNYLPHAIIFFCATFVWYATTHENDVVVNFSLVVFICCLFAYFNYSDLTKKKQWVEDYMPITVFEAVEPDPILIGISEEEKAYMYSQRQSYIQKTVHLQKILMQKEIAIKAEQSEVLTDNWYKQNNEEQIGAAWVIKTSIPETDNYELKEMENGGVYFSKQIK